MKLRYEQLFSIALTPPYYTDNKPHDDLLIEPTRNCKSLMSRYKILSRKTFDGMAFIYECIPLKDDLTALKPIRNEEKFTFKVKANNAEFWFYADVQGWESGKVYLLKNPVYNTTGDISVLSGALASPVLYRPMEFKYDVVLETVSGLLEIYGSSGTLIQKLVVRAKSPEEAAGAKEQCIIDLKNYPEGSYTLRRITSAGSSDEQVYCSVDYSPDTLAIIEITYKGDAAWTGIKPYQKYIIRVASRQADWLFDIHIRKKAVPAVTASKLSINHVNVLPEVKKTFSLDGVPDDANGLVKFRSDSKLSYAQKPMHLQLINTVTSKIVIDPLPLPSVMDIQKDALNNLFAKVIVNV